MNKGIFVKEIEDSLINKEIDLAVHSYKDLPAFLPEELQIIASSNREDSRDVLISDTKKDLSEFDKTCKIGTGSPRRTEQIASINPDVIVKPIRGNIDTRIDKLKLKMPEIVFVYSPNSAINFLNIIKNYQLVDLWMNTNLMCLGEKTSSVLNEIKWKKIFLFSPGEEEFLLYKI